MRKQLVLSIHDATPAHASRVVDICGMLETWGIRRTSVLVIPTYHGGWDLRDHPRFVDALRDLQWHGHEIVLHGFEHTDIQPRRGNPYQRIIRFAYSREGEFYTLDYAAAFARIKQGLDLLSEVGLSPVGFVAPAWLHNADVLDAARDNALRYATSLWGFHDLQRGSMRRAPAICYSPRKLRTAVASALYCDLLSPLIARCQLVRIAIHPGDVTRTPILRSLASAVRRHALKRDLLTYRDLLDSAEMREPGATDLAETTSRS